MYEIKKQIRWRINDKTFHLQHSHNTIKSLNANKKVKNTIKSADRYTNNESK